MLWVFCVVAHGTRVVILVFPFKEFGAASEMAGGVFDDPMMVGDGERFGGNEKGFPVDSESGIVSVLMFGLPVGHGSGGSHVNIDGLFIEVSHFLIA